jgi:peroxiredoxin
MLEIIMIKRFMSLLVILLCSTQTLAQEFVWAPDFPVGSKVPPIHAPDQNGNPLSLSDLSGPNGLVLVLSRSFDWCPYCISQLQDLVEVAPDFRQQGLGVATMTYDSFENLQAAEVDYGTTFPLLRDEDTQHFTSLGVLNTEYEPGSRAYGIPYPGILLLHPDGTIHAKFAEEDYRVRPAFELVMEAAQTL